MPVGGGGLIAGIASYVKALRPDVRVIGVEPFEADAMYQSLEAGRRVTLDRVGIFADGVAVREVGALTFPIVQRDRRRDRPRLERRDLRGDQGRLRRHAIDHGAGRRAGGRRPAGAGSSAPARAAQRLVAVLSGANMNFDRLRFVAERAELGEAREALFGVTIPERPGAFREFCAAHRPARRHRVQLPPERPRARRTSSSASRTESREDAAQLAGDAATRAATRRVDLTDNELAKLHVRHMVGGRSAGRRATSGSAASSSPSGPAR